MMGFVRAGGWHCCMPIYAENGIEIDNRITLKLKVLMGEILIGD